MLVPSLVLVSDVVGLEEVLQQTPSAVIADFPSEVKIPPADAAVKVTLVTGNVVNVGTVTESVFLHE
jgi:hypothetical protein